MRFWFTERGWRAYGLRVAAEAQASGRAFRVIRRKNPPKSSVMYRDDWQVALLPRELAAGFAAEAADYDDRAEIPVAALDALHAAGVSRALLPAPIGGEGISYLAFGELIRLVAEGTRRWRRSCSCTAARRWR